MSPFVGMFSLAGIGVAASLVNFVVLTSAASSANSGIFSTSRMVSRSGARRCRTLRVGQAHQEWCARECPVPDHCDAAVQPGYALCR